MVGRTLVLCLTLAALAAAGPEKDPKDDPAFQQSVRQSVDRGVAWLLARQHRDGSWESHQESYGSGMTALACYTLLKQGVPPAHPSIRRTTATSHHEPTAVTASTPRRSSGCRCGR